MGNRDLCPTLFAALTAIHERIEQTSTSLSFDRFCVADPELVIPKPLLRRRLVKLRRAGRKTECRLTDAGLMALLVLPEPAMQLMETCEAILVTDPRPAGTSFARIAACRTIIMAIQRKAMSLGAGWLFLLDHVIGWVASDRANQITFDPLLDWLRPHVTPAELEIATETYRIGMRYCPAPAAMREDEIYADAEDGPVRATFKNMHTGESFETSIDLTRKKTP